MPTAAASAPAEAIIAQDEDPHAAWANAAKWTATSAAGSAAVADDAAAPLVLAVSSSQPASPSPLGESMSSWLGWDIAQSNNSSSSDLDGL